MHFIDTHIHLQDFNIDFAPQVVDDEELTTRVLVSASFDDFEKIDKIIEAYLDKFMGAFGLHPWYWADINKVDEIKKYLIKYPNALVGEIGVDRLRGDVNDGQRELFYRQLALATEFKRNIIVHAAKAFDELKEFEKELKNITFVHHGFVKNDELISFINKCGGYIGIGSLFLKQENALEMVKKMPLDRILFETDAPFRVDQENYSKIARENITKLACLMGDKEVMLEQLYNNAREFLKC